MYFNDTVESSSRKICTNCAFLQQTQGERCGQVTFRDRGVDHHHPPPQTEHVGCFGAREARLTDGFERVQRRGSERISRSSGGRPERRFMDVVEEVVNGVAVEGPEEVEPDDDWLVRERRN